MSRTHEDERASDEPLSIKRDAFLKSVKHKQPRETSVREFLGFWGYKRRGSWITRTIERELARRNLVSAPDIAKADYYGTITILDRRDISPEADLEAGWPISSVLDIERGLTHVGPDDSLAVAETLMVMHDFSQIPVLSKSCRELYGAVTWRSLARESRQRSDVHSREAMDIDISTARSSDSLIDHIGTIIRNEYLLIRDPTNVYVGILTATDLAESFKSTSLPFIKIGEIESRIRILLDRLPLDILRAVKLSADVTREVNSAIDLTLGESIILLQNQENWSLMNIPYDRSTILRNLDDVRDIRNDVMHFRPSLDEQTIDAIDWCLNWLRTMQPDKRT